MEVRRLQVLALEVSCSVNKSNLACMLSLFKKHLNTKRQKHNLKVPIGNSSWFGDKSIRILGLHISNMSPTLKREKSYGEFKTKINKWFVNVTVVLAGS